MTIDLSLAPVDDKVHEEVGRLCSAWAYLEAVTEIALWGILDLDVRTAPLVTAKLDMRARWQMILDHAERKHAGEMSALRKINKLLVDVTRDRNIVVHGLIHSRALLGTFTFPISWTVFRGAGAGKSYPVTAENAKTIRTNIQAIGKMVSAFNDRHGYVDGCQPQLKVESGWPKPI
jgi:hypothetical protein